jgi:hypothetical protein
MSADRFDQFTRVLASGASRRQVLKALAVAVAGGAVAAFGAGRVEAAGTCSSDADCASLNNPCQVGRCLPKEGSQGRGTFSCQAFPTVTCPEGQRCCDAGKFAGQCRRGSCVG